MRDDEPRLAPSGMVIPPKPPLPTPSTPPVQLPPGWTVARPVPSPAQSRRTWAPPGLRPAASMRRDPRAWLVAYVMLLTGIAFWPVPVDSGAGPLLRAITKLFPILTYGRIEFGANILLFVPLGLLLALILRRRRYLVLPIALIATVAIEAVQGVLLGARTSSLLDVVADATGACVGLVVVEAIEAAGRRRAKPPG